MFLYVSFVLREVTGRESVTFLMSALDSGSTQLSPFGHVSIIQYDALYAWKKIANVGFHNGLRHANGVLFFPELFCYKFLEGQQFFFLAQVSSQLHVEHAGLKEPPIV